MAAEPFSAAALAINAATPFISRTLGGLFGVKSAEEEERARIEQAMAPFREVASGGTTQGQAGIAYARGRALSDLAAMASRGTAQQQAGLQREAMRQGADVQAQYAAQLAELRAREQERARQAVSQGQMALAKVAAEEAKRKRDELAGFIGGTLGMATKVFTPGELTEAEKEAARIADAKKLLGEDYASAGKAAPLTSAQIASELGMTGQAQTAAAPAAVGAAGGMAAQAAGANAGPANEIEAMLAAQDRSLASVDPSIRAYIGPGEANTQQSGLALGGYEEPISGRNRLVVGDDIPIGTRMVPMTESEKAMKLQADQETMARLQAGRRNLGESFSNVRSAIPRISSGGGRDFETQGLESTLAIRPNGAEPSQAQIAPLTTAGFPTSPAAETVESLRQQRQGRMPATKKMKRTPGGGGLGL